MKINLANRITLVRIFLVPALAVALLYGHHDLALAVFLIAAATDAADGIVARRLGQRTTLGAILDPAADKALLLTSFILMGQVAEPYMALPAWLIAVVVFRDGLIVVGIGVIHLVTGHVRWGPSWISKVTTNAQIFTVVVAMMANALIGHGVNNQLLLVLTAILLGFIWATLVFTIASGLDYTIRGVHMLSENANAAQTAPGK